MLTLTLLDHNVSLFIINLCKHFLIDLVIVVAVVGAVGSGKSSLCNSILGEMKLLKGTIGKHGRIAYVPQQVIFISFYLYQHYLTFLKGLDYKCNFKREHSFWH